MSAVAPLHDPSALANFGKLELVARLVVEGFLIGRHKSPFKGASVEFVEHRAYYPGDEIRHIDWRAFGKTGEYYVKEFEEETNLRAQLIVDCSGSMGYHGRTLSKYAYAQQLAASLAYLLLAQRDACGLITFDTAVRDRLDTSTNRRTFQILTQTLEQRKTGGETSLAAIIESILPSIKRRSLIFLISDCFDSLDRLLAVFRRLRAAHHEVVVFQIVAPEEEEFPFRSPTQFRNLEKESHRILIDPSRIREEYLAKYNEFIASLEKGARTTGCDYVRVRTDQSYSQALGAFLDSRARRY